MLTVKDVTKAYHEAHRDLGVRRGGDKSIRERERERERGSVCVFVYVCALEAWIAIWPNSKMCILLCLKFDPFN